MPLELMGSGQYVAVSTAPLPTPEPEPTVTVLPELPDLPPPTVEVASKLWGELPTRYEYGVPIEVYKSPASATKIYVAWYPEGPYRPKLADGSLSPTEVLIKPVHLALEGSAGDTVWAQLDDKPRFQMAIAADGLAVSASEQAGIGTDDRTGYVASATRVRIYEGESDTVPIIDTEWQAQPPEEPTLQKAPADWEIKTNWDNQKIEYEFYDAAGAKLELIWHDQGFVAMAFSHTVDIRIWDNKGLSHIIHDVGFHQQNTDNTPLDELNLIYAEVWLDETVNDFTLPPDLVIHRSPLFYRVEKVLPDGVLPEPPANPANTLYDSDTWELHHSDGVTVGIHPGGGGFKFTWTETGYEFTGQGLDVTKPWTITEQPGAKSYSRTPESGVVSLVVSDAAAVIRVEVSNWGFEGGQNWTMHRPMEPIVPMGWWREVDDRLGIPRTLLTDGTNKVMVTWNPGRGVEAFISGAGDWETRGSTDANYTPMPVQTDIVSLSEEAWSAGYLEVRAPDGAEILEPIRYKAGPVSIDYLLIPAEWEVTSRTYAGTESNIALQPKGQNSESLLQVAWSDDRVVVYFKLENQLTPFSYKVTWVDASVSKGATDTGFFTISGDQVAAIVEVAAGGLVFRLSTPTLLFDPSVDYSWGQYIERLAYLETDVGKVETMVLALENETTEAITEAVADYEGYKYSRAKYMATAAEDHIRQTYWAYDLTTVTSPTNAKAAEADVLKYIHGQWVSAATETGLANLSALAAWVKINMVDKHAANSDPAAVEPYYKKYVAYCSSVTGMKVTEWSVINIS